MTECGTYGDVDAVEIPRPDGDNKHEAQGSIFVRFGDELFAEQAIEAFADRSLNGKTILAGYYPEDLFKEKRFDPLHCRPWSRLLRSAAVGAGADDPRGPGRRGRRRGHRRRRGAAAPPIVLAPPPPPPNGAGRGVDNRPAWMTETQQAPPPAPPAPVDDMDWTHHTHVRASTASKNHEALSQLRRTTALLLAASHFRIPASIMACMCGSDCGSGRSVVDIPSAAL